MAFGTATCGVGWGKLQSHGYSSAAATSPAVEL
jgi:hypothetical protein